MWVLLTYLVLTGLPEANMGSPHGPRYPMHSPARDLVTSLCLLRSSLLVVSSLYHALCGVKTPELHNDNYTDTTTILLHPSCWP